MNCETQSYDFGTGKAACCYFYMFAPRLPCIYMLPAHFIIMCSLYQISLGGRCPDMCPFNGIRSRVPSCCALRSVLPTSRWLVVLHGRMVLRPIYMAMMTCPFESFEKHQVSYSLYGLWSAPYIIIPDCSRVVHDGSVRHHRLPNVVLLFGGTRHFRTHCPMGSLMAIEPYQL